MAGLAGHLSSHLGAVTDRTKAAAGRTGGALTDQAQAAYREMLMADMNRQNLRCTADKANVATYVELVSGLPDFWAAQFPGSAPPASPWELQYCVFISIDAAPPPVLTPGTPSLLPIVLRARFSDFVELPGRSASVAVSATNATVRTPEGGPAQRIVALPLSGNLQIIPTTVRSIVSISAGFVDAPFDRIPVRTRTFEAGQPAPDVTVVSAALRAGAVVENAGTLGFPIIVDGNSSSGSSTSVTHALGPITRQIGPVGYSAAPSSGAPRSIARSGDAFRVAMAAMPAPALAIIGALTDSVRMEPSASDDVLIELTAPFDVEFTASPFGLEVESVATGQRVISNTETSGTRRVGSGRWRIRFSGVARRLYSPGTGVITGPTSAEFSYELIFRPAP